VAPERVSRPYPKAARLRLERDFAAVRTRGRRFEGRCVVVRSAANAVGRPRLGVAAPRKYGGAVRRNRFRRVVRAAFREAMTGLPARDWLVAPRPGLVEPTLAGVRDDLEAAAARARP
jgi:ribonuclease P protein component